VTSLLATTIALFAAFALYIAAQSAKSDTPAAYVDAGQNLPGWTLIFAGSGALLASVGPYDYLHLLSAYGFQANQLGLSLILVALAAALFQKRLWLAARITGSRALGDVFGAHFQSASIRIYLLLVLFLFAVPFAAARLGGRTAGAGERWGNFAGVGYHRARRLSFSRLRARRLARHCLYHCSALDTDHRAFDLFGWLRGLRI
jgi:Na+/proline symporter